MTMKTKRGPGRPPIPKAQRAVKFNVTATPQVAEKFDFLCQRRNLSRGKLIAQLIQSE